MSKNVLVIGGAGYIGSHTAKLLSKRGYTPVVLDDLSTGHEWAVKYGPFVKGSYADTALVVETIQKYKIDTFFHFGAKALVAESVENPLLYFTANVSHTLNLLNAISQVATKANFIFSSTCATFGVPERIPIDETLAQKPINPYGTSKLMVEWILKDLATKNNFHYAILRYFNAAGADPEGELWEEHDPETHLVPRVIQSLDYQEGTKDAKDFNLTVHGNDYPTPDGSCIRDYIHVQDLADAHVLAMEYLIKEQKSLDLNLGTEKGSSVLEVIQAAEAITGKKVSYTVGARRPGDPPVLVANSDKAKKLLNWQPKHGLQDIIRTTL